MSNSRAANLNRARLPFQLFLCALIIFGFNIVIKFKIGYYAVSDWNWDMERLLPFTHLNRIETGSSLWDIKLQRLPGLFPLYLLAYIAKNLFVSRPLLAVEAAASLSALLIQLVKLVILKIVARKGSSWLELTWFMMTTDYVLAWLLPGYGNYLNAAFRLNWHGDSTLINILLLIPLLSALQYRCWSDGLWGLDSRRRLLVLVIGMLCVLGSLSSTLYVLIIVIPLGVTPYVWFLVSDSELSAKFQAVCRDPLKAFLRITSSSALAIPSIILVASALGHILLKSLREGCTPTVVGDPLITRAAFKTLVLDTPALIPVALSLALWAFLFCRYCGQRRILGYWTARNILGMYLSLPLLLFVYTFTSYGDVSVFYRYSGAFVMMLSPGIVAIVFDLFRGLFVRRMFLAMSSVVLVFAYSTFALEDAGSFQVYQNPIHDRLFEAYSRLGYSQVREPGGLTHVLVADGIGNVASAPVLEQLALGRVRYSQLAASIDPRLFDQSPAEFLLPSSLSRARHRLLVPSDIRNYELILTTKDLMQDQIALIGDPAQVLPLVFLDGRQYVLLHYPHPFNRRLRSYFVFYLNQHPDISCNVGVSWPQAIKNFVFM